MYIAEIVTWNIVCRVITDPAYIDGSVASLIELVKEFYAIDYWWIAKIGDYLITNSQLKLFQYIYIWIIH